MSTALSTREPSTLQPINGLLLYLKIPTRKLNSKSGTSLYEIITKGNFYVIVRETKRKMRLKKAEPSLVHLINKANTSHSIKTTKINSTNIFDIKDYT